MSQNLNCILVCFAVMSDFPSAEHWWMALGKICTPSLFCPCLCLTPISFAEDKKNIHFVFQASNLFQDITFLLSRHTIAHLHHACRFSCSCSHLTLLSTGTGLVMMIFGGQLMAYKFFRSNFVYPAELQNFWWKWSISLQTVLLLVLATKVCQ